MKKILECPFCKADCEVVSMEFGDCHPVENYRVQCLGVFKHCLDCWDDSPEEAINTWNDRY